MIEVVGVPAAGVTALPADLRQLVAGAAVLISSPRLLATLSPDLAGRRVEWPRPLLAGLPNLLDELQRGPQPVVVLATGDPLDHGIGSTLIRMLGLSAVRVHPVTGSVALARARMGWSAQETDVVSLVNAPTSTVRPFLTPRRRLLVLAADAFTAPSLADELLHAGWAAARMTVLGNLGRPDESRHELPLANAQGVPLPRLNVIAVELGDGPTLGTAPGRPDTSFDHDGQLTKREFRAMALASLRPAPGHVLWDLGAGAGSVAIEWVLHDPRCHAVAVEQDPERADRIKRNAAHAGVRSIQVVQAEVANALADLPTPDAVFLGGGISINVIDQSWQQVRPGGRLVAHSVTLDTEAILIEACRRYGGLLRRISIDRAQPLGRYLAWQPARPVVEWTVTRPLEGALQ